MNQFDCVSSVPATNKYFSPNQNGLIIVDEIVHVFIAQIDVVVDNLVTWKVSKLKKLVTSKPWRFPLAAQEDDDHQLSMLVILWTVAWTGPLSSRWCNHRLQGHPRTATRHEIPAPREHRRSLQWTKTVDKDIPSRREKGKKIKMIMLRHSGQIDWNTPSIHPVHSGNPENKQPFLGEERVSSGLPLEYCSWKIIQLDVIAILLLRSPKTNTNMDSSGNQKAMVSKVYLFWILLLLLARIPSFFLLQSLLFPPWPCQVVTVLENYFKGPLLLLPASSSTSSSIFMLKGILWFWKVVLYHSVTCTEAFLFRSEYSLQDSSRILLPK